MINIDFSSNFILGCFVSILSIAIYSIRFFNPKLAEEKDIFLSTLLLIYSGIIVIHGWRLDPILFFSQILIVFLSINFFGENLNLRLGILKQKKIEEEKLEKDTNVFVEETEEDAIDIFNIF